MPKSQNNSTFNHRSDGFYPCPNEECDGEVEYLAPTPDDDGHCCEYCIGSWHCHTCGDGDGPDCLTPW